MLSQSSDLSTEKPHVYEQLKKALKEKHLAFPEFQHTKHPEIIDVNKVTDGQLSFGDRVADRVAETVGSWPFIIIQSIILAIWIVLNSLAWALRWDPYPFILLNLALSFQAAYSAPFVMMSQNRQAAKDRLTAENDYKTDVKGELEICHIMDHLDHQDTLILQMVQQIHDQNQQLARQETLILDVVNRLEAQHAQLKEQREELEKRLNLLTAEQRQELLSEKQSVQNSQTPAE